MARSGIFVGGRDPVLADDMLEASREAMFPPFVVSLMADPSGAYTTAAAMLACVESGVEGGLGGRRVLVLGGTGPVGRIAGVLAARAGAEVTLASRSGSSRGVQAAEQTGARFGVKLGAAPAGTVDELHAVLGGADVVLACAAAGVQVIGPQDLAHAGGVRAMADVNAVPPEGIAGLGVMDAAKPIAGCNAVGWGALAIGNVKYKTQQRLLVQMRETAKPVKLGFAEAFETARAVVAEAKAG